MFFFPQLELTGIGLIGLTAVRQATATIKLMQVSTGMKSATMSALVRFMCTDDIFSRPTYIRHHEF